MRFVLKKTANYQYHWVFKAANGEVVAQSETYTSKQSALHGIQVVKQGAADASVVDIT